MPTHSRKTTWFRNYATVRVWKSTLLTKLMAEQRLHLEDQLAKLQSGRIPQYGDVPMGAINFFFSPQPASENYWRNYSVPLSYGDPKCSIPFRTPHAQPPIFRSTLRTHHREVGPNRFKKSTAPQTGHNILGIIKQKPPFPASLEKHFTIGQHQRCNQMKIILRIYNIFICNSPKCMNTKNY